MAKVQASQTALLLGILGIFFAAITADAASLRQPFERPILTISGRIGITNKEDTAQFDRPMLESLGTTSIETATPWYSGSMKFEGVSLDALMKRVGAQGERVVAIALNDYSTEIPIDDFAKYGPIIALKRNGEYMTVRDKGPLFIIYPFDKSPELKSQIYYGRCVWQLVRLVVK